MAGLVWLWLKGWKAERRREQWHSRKVVICKYIDENKSCGMPFELSSFSFALYCFVYINFYCIKRIILTIVVILKGLNFIYENIEWLWNLFWSIFRSGNYLVWINQMDIMIFVDVKLPDKMSLTALFGYLLARAPISSAQSQSQFTLKPLSNARYSRRYWTYHIHITTNYNVNDYISTTN